MSSFAMSESKKQPIINTPTGDPVPASTAPPSALKNLPVLAGLPSGTDAFLAHLHRCLQTPTGIDTVILFVSFAARLSASLLESASHTALQRSARRLVASAFALPPKTTILLSATQPSPAAARALKLVARLRALSTLLREGRTFMRLWGLLGLYASARRLLLKKPSESTDKTVKEREQLDSLISWTQLLSLTIFQVLENATLLSQKGVLGLAPASQAKAIRWGPRFWAFFIGTELVRLNIERSRKLEDADVASTEHQEWLADWRNKLVRNLAWAPLTLHWSFEKGFLPEMMISALGTIPGVILMTELWKQTA